MTQKPTLSMGMSLRFSHSWHEAIMFLRVRWCKTETEIRMANCTTGKWNGAYPKFPTVLAHHVCPTTINPLEPRCQAGQSHLFAGFFKSQERKLYWNRILQVNSRWQRHSEDDSRGFKKILAPNIPGENLNLSFNKLCAVIANARTKVSGFTWESDTTLWFC